VETAILLTLVATVAWGAGDVFVRKAMDGASPAVVLSTMIALVIVTLGALGLVLDGPSAFVDHVWRFYPLVALMGAFTWLTGNLLYFHGMKRAGIIIAAPILGAAPLPAIALAVVFAGERPSPWVWLGAVLVVGGIGILVTDRKRVLE
jgi:drug/metabolite transporter (DMT)-like permease